MEIKLSVTQKNIDTIWLEFQIFKKILTQKKYCVEKYPVKTPGKSHIDTNQSGTLSSGPPVLGQ